jgi:hypothetical protein
MISITFGLGAPDFFPESVFSVSLSDDELDIQLTDETIIAEVINNNNITMEFIG